MSNKPDDPRRPNPDVNPPPAFPPKSKAADEAPLDSDDAIDFSELGEGDVSGISAVEWAALVQGPVSTGSKPSIDAPSDMDLLSQLADRVEPVPEGKPVEEKDIAELIAEAEAEFRLEDEPPAPIGAHAADEDALFADMMAESVDLAVGQSSGRFVEESDRGITFDKTPGADSSSFVDLGAAALIEDDVVDLGSGAIVDIAARDVAKLESGVIDLGDDAIIPTEESGVLELGDDAIIVDAGAEPAGSSAAIDLGMESYLDDESAGKSGRAADSGGIDLTATGPLSRGDSGRDLLGDDILLEQPNSPAPKKHHASRDLIAEELESGTDLLHGGKRRSKEDEESDLDDFLNQNAQGHESSSVDLGSSADLSLFDEAQRSAKSHDAKGADSDIRIEDMPTDGEDYAEIDLGKIEAPAPK